MAHQIGALVGGLIAMFLLSRLTLWLLRRMGDVGARVWAAHGLALAFAVLAGGYGLSRGAGPDFLRAAATYAPGALLWLGFDALALKGRRARAGR